MVSSNRMGICSSCNQEMSAKNTTLYPNHVPNILDNIEIAEGGKNVKY